MKRYKPSDIEPKWQKEWDETEIYKADLASDKPKYIAMSMFNYPSGAGIHIGHAMNYTISDVKARFKRQQGYESYHPVGWDAFGLPAENFAIKSGVSPQKSMASIIPNYRKQYKAMGWSNDWSKEISTHEPEYYKWTQWIFSEMFRAGLAYQDSRTQWWCEKCQTVLANEQVIDGKCWRHDGADDPLVEKKEVKQWFFKITDYADELLEATDELDWTQSVKLAQKNWIGRSKGAEVSFAVANDGARSLELGVWEEKTQLQTPNSQLHIKVFTTRPDTLFGARFLVLAPEHELVSRLTAPSEKRKVENYIKQSIAKSEVERQAAKDKTGVFSGAYAINPATGKEIPIWIADYVLSGYGTGAIMAVPAHDERDRDFAKKFDLGIRQVIAPETGTKRENETFAEGGSAVVFDPETQKYAFARLENGSTCLFAGGVGQDEDLHQGILREVEEESGLHDIHHYEEVLTAYGHYRNILKQTNRMAKATCLLVVLDSTETKQTRLEAHEKFHTVWHTAEEVLGQWQVHEDGDFDHYILFLKQAVARAIELGVDKTSSAAVFTAQTFTGEGIIINSGEYDGMPSSQAREKIVANLAKEGVAVEKVNYKMRDWSVSRQRYWGAPIPIVHCATCGPVLVPDEQLPVILPELDDFQPSGDGRSALARATDWLTVTCPQCQGDAERETDTLDTYICSSWYMYRYFDHDNDQQIFDSAMVRKWEPIDFYNGADHATAHLLYARFIGHFFARKGLVGNPEPFKQFLFNGKVTASDGTMFSKSKGNGVDPLEIISQGYGADALRTYLMFAAPLDVWAKWDPQGVPGTYRFLSRLWNLVQEYCEADEQSAQSAAEDKKVLRIAHQMIRKMTDDIEHDRYNTAIAAAMTAVNDLFKLKADPGIKCNKAWREALEALIACVAPFAPHICEELWHDMGSVPSVHVDSWPKWSDELAVEDVVTLAVQVNGKLRAEVTINKSVGEAEATRMALAHNSVSHFIGEASPKRIIYVPGRIINIVL